MATNDYATINWTFTADSGIGTIELDRPDSLNAISRQMHRDISNAFEEFTALDAESDGVVVRAVVIRGSGDRAFSVGADVNEFEAVNPGVIDMPAIWDSTIEEFDAPVIAEIDGYCLGGGLETALACDFRFASDRSTFGLPEVDLGLMPGGGGTQRLTELVGRSRAKELCMTGEKITTEEAVQLGLIDHVHSPGELRDAVADFVEDIASKPPLAVRAIKNSINANAEMSLQSGRQYEHRVARSLLPTQDHERAIETFGTDVTAEFQGK